MPFHPLFKLITVDHESVTSRCTPVSNTIAFAVPQHKVDQHTQAGHTSTSVLRGTETFTEYKQWTVLEWYVLTTDNSLVILTATGSVLPCKWARFLTKHAHWNRISPQEAKRVTDYSCSGVQYVETAPPSPKKEVCSSVTLYRPVVTVRNARKSWIL
jgi:hypothetical protein